MASALVCRAEVAMLPTWLPEDQRFEVEGTSNELAQVDHTLARMRDAFHPKLRAMMPEENVGPTLQWIAHVLLPSATNETAYFDSYKKPLAAAAFEPVLMTNRAARLSYLPPSVRLELIFDDGKYDSMTRAIPGVDYPGVEYEDAGSTPRSLRLTLRAPGKKRNFKVRLQAWPTSYREVEFKWIMSPGAAFVWRWWPYATDRLSDVMKVGAVHNVDMRRKTSYVAFFAREKGSPVWGVPSFIHISSDDMGRHVYNKDGLIEYIDYDGFRDFYQLDEKHRVTGFVRVPTGEVRGQSYSNFGEQIFETYSDDKPKVTRKVKYSVVGGKLVYEVLDEDIHYKNEPMRYRNY